VLSVLLIDDQPALLEVLTPFIERSCEMSVQTASSAKEALALLQETSFDGIIVDYDLPEINGIAFLKILRAKGDTTPVIIFTGVGNERIAIEALNAGANFLLQKGDDPQMLFRELCDMVKTAVERTYIGKKLGTTKKVVLDMINFIPDPCFAIDHEGKVVAWNSAIEELTGTPASEILGNGDYLYSVPFFGTRRKILVNLIFESDDEITRQKYTIISRVPKGPVVAVTKGIKKDGGEWTLWSKAMPVYDVQGNFIAAVGLVRDLTDSWKDLAIHDQTKDTGENKTEGASQKTSKPAGFFDKILNNPSAKASSYYKEGVILFTKDKKYPEALAAFDKALEMDDKLPYVWNDRGLCYRELKDNKNALSSLTRAVELAPDNPEILFNLGETLKLIGISTMSEKYLNSAIQTFKMVTNLMPNNADAWNQIGICYKEMGKEIDSKFYFDRARDINRWKKNTPIVSKRNG